MKELRQMVFRAIDRLAGHEVKQEVKNNNALKELKGAVSVAMTRMFEVCGRKIGRRASFAAINLDDYKNIAYRIANDYKAKLCLIDPSSDHAILNEMIDAGMEGISQGLTMYDGTKNTKMSTFLFNRAQYAISKFYQKLLRDKKKKFISLNMEAENSDSELHTIIDMQVPDVFEVVDRNISHQALYTVMANLSERDRTILNLCADTNPNKVARQINVPVEQIRHLLNTVKKQINDTIGTWSIS